MSTTIEQLLLKTAYLTVRPKGQYTAGGVGGPYMSGIDIYAEVFKLDAQQWQSITYFIPNSFFRLS